MSEQLSGKRVAFLVANEGVEQVELTEPLEAVRAFFEAGKPVGAICHGSWTLIEADVVRGRQRAGVAG